VKTPPDPAHALTITLEPDNFTEEKYTLFENYQRIVHKEPPHRISKHGFRKFLCSSPLPRSKENFDGRERKLGSYHQCYRIDEKLIAIGVLDLLPQCVSSVYFMYHESVQQHSFGKLGALREIALAKEEGYQWWYAGFYIHSCDKMRYKADYSPQFILDPELYGWDLMDDELKKKLDDKRYLSMSRERVGGENCMTQTPSVEGEMDVLDEGEDSDDDAPVPNPDLPLFARSIPGILTKNQLLTEIDIDHIKLRIHGQEAETCDLVSWNEWNIDDPQSIKGILAELVAAVGADLSKVMIVTFD
jgi:arginine-tRNA-protein transferase